MGRNILFLDAGIVYSEMDIVDMCIDIVDKRIRQHPNSEELHKVIREMKTHTNELRKLSVELIQKTL